MFANRAFNIALLVSLLWHLICISAVNIVSIPGAFRFKELTSVSFLGPILEKTALDIMMANKPVAVRTYYDNDDTLRPEIRDKKNDTLLARDAMRQGLTSKPEKKMGDALGTRFQETKEVPPVTRGANKPKHHAVKEAEILWLAAPRELFYRPDKPSVPASFSKDTLFNMEFKFLVSAQGDIKEIIPLVSSGNAEVDLLGTRYLKGWKFTPLEKRTSLTGFTPKSRDGENEAWGRAKVVLLKE